MTEVSPDTLEKKYQQIREVESVTAGKDFMTTSDTQAAKNFKKAVTAAKNRRDMFWRSQAPELALMITGALEQLKETIKDPQVGVSALIDFYKRDDEIFERCDDSFGNVGDVFRITAAKMFAEYASQCASKDGIADEVLALPIYPELSSEDK
ncbi:MAG: hypothetical protein WCJ71_07730, partial [Candidatus Omnitrophota bacterium]